MPSPPGGISSSLLEDWSSEEASELDNLVDASGGALGKKERRFLEKIGGPFAERYSVSLVSPSVVPNYFPTLRVIEYNITGLERAKIWADTPFSDVYIESSVREADGNEFADDIDEQAKKKKNKKEKKKTPRFKVPDHPSKSTPPGPAYSNQPLTWLSYTQYYANLTTIDEKAKSSQAGPRTFENGNTSQDLDLYQLEYDTRDDGVYKMEDLTVRSFFKLAKRIANKNPRKHDLINSDSDFDTLDTSDDESDTAEKKKRKKKHKNRVWRTFLDRAFVGFLSDEELDDFPE
jgi:endopolyphosphatase